MGLLIACYYKKDGSMCCIVPNYVYLCVVKIITQQKKLIVMKTSSTKLQEIEITSLKNLTPLVKETLATNDMLIHHKTFSVADLWNIQRQGKYRVQRRFM